MTEDETHNICKQYNIRNYTINPDMSIDVDGGVLLYNHNLTKIPLTFNKVGGNFYCSDNSLMSLKGCPNYVGGDFSCRWNKLTSLEYCPKYVDNWFYCGKNQLNKRQSLSNLNVGGIIHSENWWKF